MVFERGGRLMDRISELLSHTFELSHYPQREYVRKKPSTEQKLQEFLLYLYQVYSLLFSPICRTISRRLITNSPLAKTWNRYSPARGNSMFGIRNPNSSIARGSVKGISFVASNSGSSVSSQSIRRNFRGICPRPSVSDTCTANCGCRHGNSVAPISEKIPNNVRFPVEGST